MPMIWNEAADAKLFAGVLATSESLKLKYDDLAEWMGNDCTAKAISHRISAVRKVTKDTVTSEAKTTKPKGSAKRKGAVKEEGDGEANGKADETPSKPKKARTPRKKATLKKVDVAAEDDEEEEGTNGVKVEVEEDTEEELMVEDAGIVGGEA